MTDQGRRAGGAFAREVGRAAAAVAVTFVGLVLLMASVTWFVEDVEEWWQALVAAALAVAIAAGALTAIGATAGGLLAEAAAGWAGLLRRRAPQAVARDAGPRAAADLVVAAACAAGGALAFRAGAAAGEVHWSVEGLLLVVAGGLFGLGPLVPRAALLLARRRGRPWKVQDDGAGAADALIGAALAACLGVGLSMGVADAFASVRRRPPGPLAPGVALEGRLVDRPGLPWPRRASLELPPVQGPGVRLALELTGCAARLEPGGPVGPGTVELRPGQARLVLEPTSDAPAAWRVRLLEAEAR